MDSCQANSPDDVAIARRAPADSDADTCFQSAQIHDKNGEPEKAIEQLDRALSSDPDHFEALWLRALIHLDGWRIEQSIADLDRALGSV